jgi:hypothetical protein
MTGSAGQASSSARSMGIFHPTMGAAPLAEIPTPTFIDASASFETSISRCAHVCVCVCVCVCDACAHIYMCTSLSRARAPCVRDCIFRLLTHAHWRSAASRGCAGCPTGWWWRPRTARARGAASTVRTPLVFTVHHDNTTHNFAQLNTITLQCAESLQSYITRKAHQAMRTTCVCCRLTRSLLQPSRTQLLLVLARGMSPRNWRASRISWTDWLFGAHRSTRTQK